MSAVIANRAAPKMLSRFDAVQAVLPALTDAKFNNQREVVLNERRQNYENSPYGMVIAFIRAEAQGWQAALG